MKYPWPGNVRELANAVKHGAVLSRGEDVDVADLPEDVLGPALVPDDLPLPGLVSLAEAEKRHINSVLKACGGQQPRPPACWASAAPPSGAS